MPKKKQYKLKRSLGLWATTLYGVGIILGAGIYALLGVGAGIAGDAIWISFVIAGLLAFFTGFSYAELSSMYTKDAAEYVYTKKAFRKESLSFVLQWLMIFTGIVSSATVALGFAGYFTNMFGGSIALTAVGLIVILSLISYKGMKESTEFNIVSTIIETSGLLVIIVLGFMFLGNMQHHFLTLPSTGLVGILTGTTVIFFAYIGFEQMVNLSEETKNAKKIMPRALVLALVISTILYILTAITAVSIVGSDTLAASSAPLTEVVSVVIPEGAFIFSIIALFATANTVLIMLIVASRMIYGLSENRSLPKYLGKVGKNKTPFVSITIVAVLVSLFLMSAGIKEVALLTNIGIFIVYIFINAAVIFLRYREPNAKRTFRSPLSIGRFPVLALLGILTSLAIIIFFEPRLLFYEILVIITGFLFFKIYTTYQKKRHK